MKFLKQLTLILTLGLTSAKGATFYVSNMVDLQNDILFQTSGTTSAPLLSGGIVALGYFTDNLYVPSGEMSSISTTIADFTTITSALTGSPSSQLGEAGTAGYVDAAAYSAGSIVPVNALIGRTLYMFVGNQSTLAASTAFALQAVGVIADDTLAENSYYARPNLINTPVFGQINTDAYTGNPFPSQSLGTRTFDTFQLEAIPEPSTFLLASLGVIALLRRRR